MSTALLIIATPALAQRSSSVSLVGTWTLELVDNIRADGTRIQLYGPDPQGVLTFDASGRYALQIMRAVRPRFAGNDRLKGSDHEVRALAEGINTHWGRYAIDSSRSILQFEIDHASFPNWEGQKRSANFTLVGDRLTYTVASPTTGGPGVVGEVVWRRLP